jgi:hypothetical protein
LPKAATRRNTKERSLSYDFDDLAEKLFEALKLRVRDEMRRQLERNPSADRRRILETALKFERQNIEKSESEEVRVLLAGC